MLMQLILAVFVLSLAIWGLEMAPLPAVPKRLLMAAVVLVTALSLADRAGLLH